MPRECKGKRTSEKYHSLEGKRAIPEKLVQTYKSKLHIIKERNKAQYTVTRHASLERGERMTAGRGSKACGGPGKRIGKKMRKRE